ncbi:MAG: cation:dicarboxylase symporter family transporter, partial [Succinivibrio sp.]|nr:cation:dicarboxylase symporter family transporter [Succinivibrio sp.]
MIENTDRINQATNTAYAQISKKSRIITAILYVGALIIGALLGYIANDSLKEIFDFVATIFTRLFSFIAVPVIAISLITTLSKLSKGSKGGTIFGYTIFYTLLTTILAATIGAIVFATIAPANVPQELASDGASAVSQYESLSYLQHIISIVPNNLLQPFVAGNVLSILLVAAAFG